jgi:cytochrome c oxidase subunit 4
MMDRNLLFLIEFWAAFGVFIGGVVTPIVAGRKKLGDWAAMLIGVVVGAVGNVVLLVPLWMLLSRLQNDDDDRLPWQRDASSLDDARASATGAFSLAALRSDLPPMLRQNFWPNARAMAHGHSHRQTYVFVFIALAVITAIEVTITYIDLPISAVGPLVALSTAKVVLVVMYFMHLRFDSKWYTAIFVFSLPFAAMVLAVLAVA